MKNNQFGFVIRPCYRYLQGVLTRQQLGNLWVAIIDYLETQDIEKIQFDSDLERLAFLGIKTQIDKDRDQYQKKCSTNKANGHLGGRPGKQ